MKALQNHKGVTFKLPLQLQLLLQSQSRRDITQEVKHLATLLQQINQQPASASLC